MKFNSIHDAQPVQRSRALHESPAAKALNDTLLIQVREQYRAFYYVATADLSLLPPYHAVSIKLNGQLYS